MDFYFDADIFLGRKAGIYRYSKEIAARFYSDPDVNCRFVSSSALGGEAFSEVLNDLFGERACLYEMYCSKNGERIERRARLAFRMAKARYEAEPSFVRKMDREYRRLKYESENSKLVRSGAHFLFGGKQPVVFSPLRALAPEYFSSPDPVFKVQVVHDLIPVLHRDFCGRTRTFDEAYQVLGQLDMVVTDSESTRRDLLRMRPDLTQEKVIAIPLAASNHFAPVTDLNKISAVREKYGIPAGSDYIFAVSTLEPRKNQLRLIEAWSDIVHTLSIKDPKLVIAGSRGWGDGYLESLDRCDEINKSVLFTGFVEDEDLPALYSGSVLTAYPSLYEGFGLPVLESISCGKFCVTSNVSSIPEITGDDYPLVNPESVKEISDLISKGVNDGEFRRRMEQKGLMRAEKFDWDKTYERTKAAIQIGLSRSFGSRMK
ncbi:glycosyltransferase family 4 protein [Ketobacter sp.]|uniref:glycosyltransferase family 4 protein n=1 Tax=Ketobacter sp. TaxID=2083498 RepID=UPI000F1F66AB|nr:glycosyltransferase family 1 protein [Ketobacter sp.]RLU01367.1 MAG: glycosyltransferase family 1 protein [Ketobacter sp.]